MTAPQPLSVTASRTWPAGATIPVAIGTKLTWTATVDGGGAPVQYLFYRYKVGSGWELMQPYSSSSTFTWIPGGADAGTYKLQVWAKNGGSTAGYDAVFDTGTFEVGPARPLTVLEITRSVLNPAVNMSTTWTVHTDGGSAPLEYKFWVQNLETGAWTLWRDYGEDPSFTWTPASFETGNRRIQVWVRAKGSTAAYDEWLGTEYFRIQ